MSYPILAARDNWYKGTTAKSTITEIIIVDSYTPTGEELENWSADVNDTGAITCYVNGTALIIAGNGSGKIKCNTDSAVMFSDISFTETECFNSVANFVGLNILDTSETRTLQYAFLFCSAVESLDLNGWDVLSVQIFAGMFRGCSALQSLEVGEWDTKNATNMRMMFYHCDALQTLDVSNWNTSNVTNMSNMFAVSTNKEPVGPTELDVSNWNTSKVTDMSFMFWGYHQIDTLDVSNWDVSKVTTFDHFSAHSRITFNGVENWRTTSATNMNGMFHQCRNTAIDLSNFDTSNVTVLSQMFEGAHELQSILGLENFNTANCVDFSEMFALCDKLKELDLSSFDTRNAKDGVTVSRNGTTSRTCAYMLHALLSLQKITFGENFSFNGDGSTTIAENIASLETPDAEYIPGADGYWYDTTGRSYTPADIPSNTAMTYYACSDTIDSKAMINVSSLVSTGKAIRKLNGSDTKYKPSEFAEMISTLGADAYETGYRAHYDLFWDTYQENGNRIDYAHAFHRNNWTDEIFIPKYDICASGWSASIFQYSNITRLKGKLDELGLKFDTTGITVGLQMFQGAKVVDVPTLDLTASTNNNYMFGSGPLTQSIEKIIVADTTPFTNSSFESASSLASIIFEGTIGCSINFQWSPLTVESMKSVITHLKDYSETEYDRTYSVTFSDECWTLLDAEGATSPNNNTWRDYAEDLGWIT